MENNNSDENVWINREEYERLKKIADVAPAHVITSNSQQTGPIVFAEPRKPSSSSKFVSIALGVAAILLFISLVTPTNPWIAPIGTMLLIVFSIIAFIDFVAQRKTLSIVRPQNTATYNGAFTQSQFMTAKPKSNLRKIITVLLILALMPIIIPAIYFIFIIILFSFSGGPSS